MLVIEDRAVAETVGFGGAEEAIASSGRVGRRGKAMDCVRQVVLGFKVVN